jgi:hypothetical protein
MAAIGVQPPLEAWAIDGSSIGDWLTIIGLSKGEVPLWVLWIRLSDRRRPKSYVSQ